MKEINLKNAMSCYAKARDAEKHMYFARDWAKCNAGSVWKAKAEEDSEKAEAAWKDAVKESEEALSAALDDAIREAQGKAKERLITSSDVAYHLYKVEETLCIPKKAMNGIEVSVDDHAQNFPRAYKYRAQSTRFEAVYRNGSWRVTDIRRDDCRRESQKIIVKHTEESKKALLERFTIWA